MPLTIPPHTRGRWTQLKPVLTLGERAHLEHLLRSPTTGAGLARRVRLLLCVADGWTITHAAQLVGLTRRHAHKWLERFQARRIDALHFVHHPGEGTGSRGQGVVGGGTGTPNPLPSEPSNLSPIPYPLHPHSGGPDGPERA